MNGNNGIQILVVGLSNDHLFFRFLPYAQPPFPYKANRLCCWIFVPTKNPSKLTKHEAAGEDAVKKVRALPDVP